MITSGFRECGMAGGFSTMGKITKSFKKEVWGKEGDAAVVLKGRSGREQASKDGHEWAFSQGVE